MVKTKVSDWVERNFVSLTVFGGNLLLSDVHSSVTMGRHVQAWQWIGSISLVTWGLLWASVCSLEACDCFLGFLLLTTYPFWYIYELLSFNVSDSLITMLIPVVWFPHVQVSPTLYTRFIIFALLHPTSSSEQF